MAEPNDAPKRRGFGLRDVSGTTIAVTSLAILGAAAVVTTPVWLWYRRKRKRTDALLRDAVSKGTRATDADAGESASAAGSARPRGLEEPGPDSKAGKR